MQSYILIVVVVAFILLVFTRKVFQAGRRRKKQRELAMAYDRLVKEHKLFPEHRDVLESKIIGLDKRNKKLVLIDHRKKEKQELCISLSDLAAAGVIEVTDDEKNGIKKVFLELKHKKNNMRTRFCFYDNDQDELSELKSLMRRAQHWKSRIDFYKFPGSISTALEYVL